SSGREISEHLHCWRTPVMLSHTEDFNPDYRGYASVHMRETQKRRQWPKQ
ncbi:hypothetical protein E3U43_021929, partial [Larimichthys crocea]